MKAKPFNYFREEVLEATRTSTVWSFSEYWTGMTAKQADEIAQILDRKPDVRKLIRDGETVYQLPNGREWMA